ncbi:uncharacterized protein LOC123682792 [Harmonia axyridis]|uniref:uncharacterized protein LOC123682792 n=1 Tax=Harmonia axyridis TaxID=115357 RepID=UPI001E276949|nr:uncharacterized protein LOC123682792 [Harmonia axyridis]
MENSENSFKSINQSDYSSCLEISEEYCTCGNETTISFETATELSDSSDSTLNTSAKDETLCGCPSRISHRQTSESLTVENSENSFKSIDQSEYLSCLDKSKEYVTAFEDGSTRTFDTVSKHSHFSNSTLNTSGKDENLSTCDYSEFSSTMRSCEIIQNSFEASSKNTNESTEYYSINKEEYIKNFEPLLEYSTPNENADGQIHNIGSYEDFKMGLGYNSTLINIKDKKKWKRNICFLCHLRIISEKKQKLREIKSRE